MIKKILPLRTSRNGPPIPLLYFADDYLLFFQAKSNSLRRLNKYTRFFSLIRTNYKLAGLSIQLYSLQVLSQATRLN